MAQTPSKARVLFDVLARDYGTLDFQDALADFIAQVNCPEASGHALQHHAHNTHIPFIGVPVYHKIKFTKCNGFEESRIVDVVHVWLEQKDSHGWIIPGHFDTVLVNGRGPHSPTSPKPEMTMTLSRSMTSCNWEIDSSRVCAPGSSGNSKWKLARKEGRMLALNGTREAYDGSFARFHVLSYPS